MWVSRCILEANTVRVRVVSAAAPGVVTSWPLAGGLVERPPTGPISHLAPSAMRRST